jgi:hypothetical protein
MSQQGQTDDGSPNTHHHGKQDGDEKHIHAERSPFLDLGTLIPISL